LGRLVLGQHPLTSSTGVTHLLQDVMPAAVTRTIALGIMTI
jgi:hypothetical protein